jgi:hypothetical protein
MYAYLGAMLSRPCPGSSPLVSASLRVSPFQPFQLLSSLVLRLIARFLDSSRQVLKKGARVVQRVGGEQLWNIWESAIQGEGKFGIALLMSSD